MNYASAAANTSHSSYLSALRQIDSIPVHDLAATLTNPSLSAAVALQAHEDETWFQDPQNEWRAQNATASQRLRAVQEQLQTIDPRNTTSPAAHGYRRMEGSGNTTEGRDDVARRERLQRVLSRLNRLHGNTGANAPASGTYGENAPNHNSLYDWSPPSLAELEDANEEAELETIRRELRRQLPNHHPEVLRVMSESVRSDMQRASSSSSSSRFASTQHDSAPPRTEQSLRSQAILQAVRRHPRFSARSREYMQRYIADRADRSDRSGSGAGTMGGVDTRERYSPTSDRYPWNRRSTHESTVNDDSRSRLRRSMLADPPANNSDEQTDYIKRAVVYLGNLRRSRTYEDSLGYAVDGRFVTKEFFGENHDDFILDLSSLAPIQATSILTPGSKFKGCQRANPDLNPASSRIRRRWERELGGWDNWHSNTSQDYLPRLTLDDPTRPVPNIPPHAQRATMNTRYNTPDQWPVEVTVHEVDWKKMKLSATMEAQDVPSHAPPVREPWRINQSYQRAESPDSLPDLINPDGSVHVEPPRRYDTPPPQLPPLSVLAESKREPLPLKTITTYLEGEILDFRNHTFLTENFQSTAQNDATYWRKLEPFRDLSEDVLLQKLLSRTFLEELNENYILMRWKERCFVDDPKATHSSELVRPGESNMEMGEGCGLTISGFYYVCLRRSDGHIEGLYCDPQSSPYQHLVLERSQEESWFWSWEFK